jgi:hypothetical protein
MLEQVKKHLINARGRSIPEKLIVFESDDWGSIRMPDNESREFFLSKGWVKKNDRFSEFDSLESEDDLRILIETLKSFRDLNGKHPVITTNTIVCNPDFEAIRKSGFKQYKTESFIATYKQYPNHRGSFELLKEGIRAGVLYPQFHGREHVNVEMWMRLLRAGDERFHEAFNRRCFSIDYVEADNRRTNLMAALDYHSSEGLDFVSNSISDGLNCFEAAFGFRSTTAIAPCYVWDAHVEKVFAAAGVRTLQSSKYQNEPSGDSYRRRFHYMGQPNIYRQVYTVRNCLFEPSLNTKINWVEKCLESIGIAFTWRKPAVIGTHRLNYMGHLKEVNRAVNIKLLSTLLQHIVRKWPDVRFVTSADIATQYHSGRTK